MNLLKFLKGMEIEFYLIYRQNMTTILVILLERETLGKFIKTRIKNEYKNIRKRHKSH